MLSYVAGAPDVLTLDAFSPTRAPSTEPTTSGLGRRCRRDRRPAAFLRGPGRPQSPERPCRSFDSWDSDITLARVTDVVMETKDSDGTRMVIDIPRLATNGVTIAVGLGGFAASSFTARDTSASVEFATLRKGGGLEIDAGAAMTQAELKQLLVSLLPAGSGTSTTSTTARTWAAP